MTGHSRKRRATSADGRAGQRARTDATGPDTADPGTAGPGSGVPATLDDGRRTPESRPDLLAMQISGSPTRVSGRKVTVDTKFAKCDSTTDPCKVDKSLVCIGFWEIVEGVGRICLPRRSGKTYNLIQLLLFFSLSSELDYVEAMSDSMIAETDSEMDTAAHCRKKRECLFKDSLLQTMHLEFYTEHFMKYPVLYISLSKCKGASFGTFIRALCDTIASVIKKWLEEIELTGANISIRAKYPLDELKRKLLTYQNASDLPSSQMSDYTDLAQSLFQALSTFIAKQYGHYLLLIDEYDIPFVSIYLAKWSDEDKQAALEVMKALFQDMLKDNNNMRKGLLFGVFEIPLTEMGSGANNIMDIHMIPTKESDIQLSLLLAPHSHSGRGMDALTDSFWFNSHEVEKMLDNSALQCTHIAKHKTLILRTIREWYNGYYIGRFRGKYNPWSVNSFIAAMYNSLSHVPTDKEVDIAAIIESAAKEYWVTTGTTRLIDKFIEEYPNEISRITEDLIREYQVNKFGTPNQRVSTNQRRLAGSVSLTSTALDVFKPLGRQFEKDEFLSLCFYGGYLTRRTIGTVCIPNQELFMVWRKMFGRIATGPEMTNELENCPKGKLLEDLWANDTDFLCSLVKSSHSALANHNDFKEREYADHASAAFHVAAVFGALTPSSQPNVRISDLVMSRESHVGRGKCDCLMRLYSTTNRPNGFGVLVEYKTIPHNLRATVTQDLARGPNANDDGAIEEEVVRRQKEIAEKGLLQITTASYATGLAGCLERMDVCLAINNDTVYAVSQLYKRSNIGVEWRKVDSLL